MPVFSELPSDLPEEPTAHCVIFAWSSLNPPVPRFLSPVSTVIAWGLQNVRPSESPSCFPTVDRVPIIPAVSAGGAISQGEQRACKSNWSVWLPKGVCISDHDWRGTEPVAENGGMVMSFSLSTAQSFVLEVVCYLWYVQFCRCSFCIVHDVCSLSFPPHPQRERLCFSSDCD